MKSDTTYHVTNGLRAGKNSDYSIKGSDGSVSPLAFNSKSEAQNHIDSRVSKGQDPTSLNTDWHAMGQALLKS